MAGAIRAFFVGGILGSPYAERMGRLEGCSAGERCLPLQEGVELDRQALPGAYRLAMAKKA